MKTAQIISLFVLIQIWFGEISYAAFQNDIPADTVANKFETNPKLKIWTALTSGDSALNKGELGEAEKYYKVAYSLVDKALFEKKGHRISIFNETVFDPIDKLGQLYLLTNNLRKAEYYFDLSNKIRNAHLPKTSLFRVPPLVGLGEVYLARNDLQKAKSYFTNAEKVFYSSTTSFYNPDNIGKSILINQFEISLKEKNYKEAARYMERMSSGGLGTGFDKNSKSKIPRVLELKARYYLAIEDYQQSWYYITKAKQFALVISDALIYFKVLRTEALLSWTQQNIGAAAETFKELTHSYKNYIINNFSSMSEYERESFFTKLKKDFDLFNTFILQNSDYGQIEDLYQLAYNNQLFSKALLLNQINKMKNGILASGNRELIKQLNHWEAAKAYLSSLYYQKKPNHLLIDQTESTINELERELNRKTELLKNINQDINWKDVQSTLGDSEVAVEIIRTKGFNLITDQYNQMNFDFNDTLRYMMLYVSRKMDKPQCFTIDNGRDLEGKYSSLYRNAIKHQLQETDLYRQYWSPIKKHLESYHTVYLSADGIFNQINLNTLQNPDTKKYVLNEMNLVFVTNTKDLVGNKIKSEVKKAALFGRPKYLINSSNLELDKKPIEKSDLRSLNSEVFDNFREQTFVDLPGTEEEVRSIENLLINKGWEVKSNFGESATEENLKNSINPYILHIATHGFFLQQNNLDGVNSMIRSGIILAGVNKPLPSTSDDGVLTAYEATNLDLDSTYLVVLSACETGLGEIKNGEGVYGLQRGLAVAGARYILMSLWKVDDFATRFLMEEFYNKWLEEEDIHDAFRDAQIELRKNYPHPFYWGAFVLLGN